MDVATYTKSGAKATTPVKLDKTIFGVEFKSHQLLKDAYLSYLANGRTNNAVAKRRADVSGGGRKPWRQKGTGNARFGSSRNPIWRGGGVAFGPTGNENYSRKLPTIAKRQALKQALTLGAKEDRIKVIETFDASTGKVRRTRELLKKFDAKGQVLLVVSKKEDLDNRATRNVPSLKHVQARYLNVYDIMNADTILISRGSLEIIQDWLGAK